MISNWQFWYLRWWKCFSFRWMARANSHIRQRSETCISSMHWAEAPSGPTSIPVCPPMIFTFKFEYAIESLICLKHVIKNWKRINYYSFAHWGDPTSYTSHILFCYTTLYKFFWVLFSKSLRPVPAAKSASNTIKLGNLFEFYQSRTKRILRNFFIHSKVL